MVRFLGVGKRKQTDPIYGVRAWEVGSAGLSAIIPSDLQNQLQGAWQPGASCSCVLFPRGHRKPRKNCSCGYYSLKDVKDIGQYGGDVIGVVRLSGKVFVHERGYRSQYAQPVYLQVSTRLTEDPLTVASNLTRIYGCRTVVSKETVWEHDRKFPTLLKAFQQAVEEQW